MVAEGRFRLVRQRGKADCAACCLVIVFRWFGRALTRADAVAQIGATWTSAAGLVRASRALGLDAIGVQLAPADIVCLPPASIMFWRQNHYVVLAGAGPRSVRILDPARGRVSASMATVARAFTGYAIVFGEPHDRPDREIGSPGRAR